MFTSILPVGGIVGPVLGGVIVTYWSWRGIFFINVPTGIIVAALSVRFIPHSAPRAVSAPTSSAWRSSVGSSSR